MFFFRIIVLHYTKGTSMSWNTEPQSYKCDNKDSPQVGIGILQECFNKVFVVKSTVYVACSTCEALRKNCGATKKGDFTRNTLMVRIHK